MSDPIEFALSTKQFAEINMVKPESIHSRLCRFGSYFGIMPVKLANGRMAWPQEQARADTHRHPGISNATSDETR
jgi:hypothetical protein